MSFYFRESSTRVFPMIHRNTIFTKLSALTRRQLDKNSLQIFSTLRRRSLHDHSSSFLARFQFFCGKLYNSTSVLLDRGGWNSDKLWFNIQKEKQLGTSELKRKKMTDRTRSECSTEFFWIFLLFLREKKRVVGSAKKTTNPSPSPNGMPSFENFVR